MNEIQFLKPKLVGARFQGHAIPLEVLKDLAVLEEMVIEVAKWQFIKDHPGRERAPRGFTDGIELKLTAVEDGRAIPVIILCIASATLFPPDNQVYFEKARESIVCAVAAAERGTSARDHLPQSALGYFDRIGRGLRDEEAIEFPTAGQTTPARLTRETRRRLVAESNVTQVTEEVAVRGSVPEADQADMTFEIQLFDGRKIKAPMTTANAQAVLDAFTGYKTGVRVLLQGIGKFNRQGKLEAFDSVEHVNQLDPLDVPARLEELRNLKAGWLDGAGEVPSVAGLDWLSNVFSANFSNDAILPYVYPTPEGNLRAEWAAGGKESSLDVDLASHKGAWHGFNTQTQDEEERELNLDNSDDWAWLAMQVRDQIGGAA